MHYAYLPWGASAIGLAWSGLTRLRRLFDGCTTLLAQVVKLRAGLQYMNGPRRFEPSYGALEAVGMHL